MNTPLEQSEGMTCDRRFDEVRQTLVECLNKERDEQGAALCVYFEGRSVVNIWGGAAEPGIPWTNKTLQPLTSITKPILTFALLRLAEQGLLDLDGPVAEVWPEFAANGKADLRVSHVLSHAAGLPIFKHPVTLDEQIARVPLLEQLEQMAPLWSPGSAHGYHAITFGFIVTEILRRSAGLAPEAALNQLVAAPLNAQISLGIQEHEIPLVARIQAPKQEEPPAPDSDPEIAEYCTALTTKSSLLYRATFGSTAMTFEDMNDLRYLTAPRPAGYGTAHGVARAFAAAAGVLDGHEWLSPNIRKNLRKRHAHGIDQVFRVFTSWGLGVLLPGTRLIPNLPNGAFGHLGSTGSIAFADPDNALAFAFLPSRMKSVFEIPDKRASVLIECVYRCLLRSKRKTLA